MISEIYPNLPVLCLTQHFTGPQIKKYENPETAHPSKKAQNISKLTVFCLTQHFLQDPK